METGASVLILYAIGRVCAFAKEDRRKKIGDKTSFATTFSTSLGLHSFAMKASTLVRTCRQDTRSMFTILKGFVQRLRGSNSVMLR
jgi:hypothetical protein